MKTTFILCVGLLVWGVVSSKPASDMDEDRTLVQRVASLEKRVRHLEIHQPQQPKLKEFLLTSEFEGKEVRQDIVMDETDKTETEVITFDGKEQIIHNDFERNITVIAVPEQMECFIKTLDTRLEKDGFQKEKENLELARSAQGGSPVNETREEYRATDQEVVDEELGDKVLALCDGYTIQWIEQVAVQENKKEGRARQKRHHYHHRSTIIIHCGMGCTIIIHD